MRTLPAGTVTFLFTDIEGSTRLLHDIGPEAYARALAEHRRALRGAFTAYGGVEVDTQGDAFFVAFPTAEGATAAATEGNAALSPGPIRVRVGLHTGAPTVTDDGYVGEAVHLGARIGALAHGGQVLLSAATCALLPDTTEVRHLGRHRLKDFPAAVPIYQLGGDDFPPLRTPGSVDLPHPATPFLGRGRELFDAVAVVLEQDPQVLTILGPGGTGKTRFAIELARRLAEQADGGTVFLPLAPVRDIALALPSIATALGAVSSDLSAVATRIGEKRTHVVLDNLEQLLPDAAVMVAQLAAAAPALRLVVTSREALRIGAETQFELPPLAVEEGVALFLARARAARPDVRDSPAVEALCIRLDLMPLALELAAARSKLLSPEALLERIGSRLDLLTGSRDADPRHATLRTTIAWSYDLLDDRERVLFDRLAVFRGGCTLASAEAVCAADVATLEALLDKSLLRRRSDEDGSDRFWMHETIREFAAERLAQSPARDEVPAALARWLVNLLMPRGDSSRPEVRRPEELDLAQRELDNVRFALDWSIGNDPDLGLELTVALEQFWVIREPLEGTAWHRKLLDAAQSAPALLRARGLCALGGALDIVGEHRSAEALYRDGVQLLEALGDEDEASYLRFRVGAAAVNSGDTARGWPLIEAALVAFRQAGDSVRTAQALSYLSRKAEHEGDLLRAVQLGSESAALAHKDRWSWWEAHARSNLAALERRRGNLAAATAQARKSAALAETIHDRMLAVFAAAELASAAALAGEAELAGRLWGAIQAEEEGPPIGQWAAERAAYEEIVRTAAAAEFERGRSEGRLLSLAVAGGAVVPPQNSERPFPAFDEDGRAEAGEGP